MGSAKSGPIPHAVDGVMWNGARELGSFIDPPYRKRTRLSPGEQLLGFASGHTDVQS